jgi:cation diffusion facilitator family transporter
MSAEPLASREHDHDFLGARHSLHERRTWAVVALTSVMMVAEIGGGTLFGSMALIADGLHMGTHVAALSIAAAAYSLARRHVRNDWFSFGTGKLGDLAGFASAIVLAMVALLIGYESIMRLINPVAIGYAEAIPIAVLALAVNLASVFLLHDHDHGHDNGHDDDHDHDHDHDERGHDAADRRHHVDHNFRAAYIHILADAFTSLLAICALAGAAYFGWVWLDPVAGLIGFCVISVWSYSLIKSSAAVLLDAVASPGRVALIKQRLESEGDRVTDLHLWRLGPGHLAVIAAIVTPRSRTPDDYKAQLVGIDGLSHIHIEVNPDRRRQS